MLGTRFHSAGFAPQATSGAGLARGDTVPVMFWDGVARRGNQVALRQKDFGIWKPMSWTAIGEIVREVAMGLAARRIDASRIPVRRLFLGLPVCRRRGAA